MYRLTNAGISYGPIPALADVSLTLEGRQFVSIIGPNGAGKSTLLGLLAGMKPNYAGSCLFENKEVSAWSRRDFARQVSFVPQAVHIDFPFTAEEVVLMGRTPHVNGLFESPEDHEAVRDAMQSTDSTAFRGRDFRSLSGGEQQRVVLATALAQKPRVLLLDEPTTYLDLRHQIDLYRLLRELSRGILVVAVTHDLNLASAYADRMLLLRKGRLTANDTPSNVLNELSLKQVFEVDASVIASRTGRPHILYGD